VRALKIARVRSNSSRADGSKEVAAGRFTSVAEVLLAGKEALEQREAYEDRVEALRRAGEEGLASLCEHAPQLESDEAFEAFMDEAEAEALRQ
jgi:Arc/MetJ-type ribon-helix-helix transcriptional regulator